MTKPVLYKLGAVSVLGVLSLWSFYALPKHSEEEGLIKEEKSLPISDESALLSEGTIEYLASPSASPPIKTFTPSPTPSIKPVLTETKTPSPTFIPTPLPTQASTPTPTPTPLPETPTPSPTPSQTPVQTPEGGHIFYLSTYHTSRYYYCDTDNGWKSLSPTYLKSYPSEQALLADYPSRTLHEPCK